MDGTARVFVSHSSEDKEFVRKLVGDLERQELDVWFDERELRVGDSIVEGIEGGLKDTDYLLAVLSPNSMRSQWVRAEMNSALMSQLSDMGTVVLPVVIADCEIPPLLRDRVYADFRGNYERGLNTLLNAFEMESTPADSRGRESIIHTTCEGELAKLSLADLRRRMVKRLSRKEISIVWSGVFEERMDDELPNQSKVECAMECVLKAKAKSKLDALRRELCEDYPEVQNP